MDGGVATGVASGGDFCGSGVVVVLADTFGVEEGVSGGGVGWRRKKKLEQRRRGRCGIAEKKREKTKRKNYTESTEDTESTVKKEKAQVCYGLVLGGASGWPAAAAESWMS